MGRRRGGGGGSVSAHRVKKNAKSQGMPKLNMSDMNYLVTDVA